MFAVFAFAIVSVAPAAPVPLPGKRPVSGYTVHALDRNGVERITHVRTADNVCVLDAIAALPGGPVDAMRSGVWIERPVAGGKPQVLPVDWAAIALRGAAATNYQLLAGDRLYLRSKPGR